MRESTGHSVPEGSLPFPSRTPMLLWLTITQLPDSLWLRPCASMLVYETNSICSVCRKIDSVVSDNFLTKTRSGIGSLQVRIEGFGSLASADTRGGPAVRSVVDRDIF